MQQAILRPYSFFLEWIVTQEKFLFWLLVILHVLPLWIVSYFPFLDGPNHLEIANVIKNYHQADGSIFRQYYSLNNNFDPTWFLALVLAGLMYIAPALTAEKILISGYIILFAFSIRYALQAINSQSSFLTILGFPFIYNYTFHAGFYGFSYSLAIFFLVVGYWIKNRNDFTLNKKIILTLLTILLYFCHPVSLVMAYVVISIFTLWLIGLDLKERSLQNHWNIKQVFIIFWRRGNIILYGIFPTFLLMTSFLNKQKDGELAYLSFKKLINMLVNFFFLWSYGKFEIWMGRLILILFFSFATYLIFRKLYHFRFNFFDILLLTVIVGFLFYFIVPEGLSGGGSINLRLSIYPFFLLILWFGAQSYSLILKKQIVIVATLISLSLLGFHTLKYIQFNDYLKEYLSASQFIEFNTTILPVNFFKRGKDMEGKLLSNYIEIFSHTAGYIAVSNNAVYLNNYQASRKYFPIKYRPEVNPRRFIVPDLKILDYNQQTKGIINYVLVWGINTQSKSQKAQNLLKQLRQGYQLIYTSKKRKLMQVYRYQN